MSNTEEVMIVAIVRIDDDVLVKTGPEIRDQDVWEVIRNCDELAQALREHASRRGIPTE